ncbi:MAG TPA: hypothetical protein VGO52_21885 [Hyphomonadaceae bacterium]|jgi:hypothetical protein|nr:hypothetical protein [Hyphomonadaceae bacterium]
MSIGAIYLGTGKRRVQPCGSCVFVEHKGFVFIVTAEHVLDEHQHGPLILVGPGGSAPLTTPFSTLSDRGIDPQFDVVDIGIGFLDANTRERIGAIEPVSSDDIANTGDSYDRGFIAVGFPASKNKQRANGKAVLESHAFFLRAKEFQSTKRLPGFHPRSHLLLNWSPKDSIKPDGVRSTAPSLRGTSGGPVFDIGNFTSMELLAGLSKPRPRLVGVITRWLENESALVVSRLPHAFDEMIDFRRRQIGPENG